MAMTEAQPEHSGKFPWRVWNASRQANEKVAQAEETLIKCSEAEDGQRALRRGGGTVGRRNRGSKEDPDVAVR